MIKSKKLLKENLEWIYRITENLDNVLSRIRKLSEDVNVEPLIVSIQSLIKITENLVRQIELLEKSESYQQEIDERYDFTKKIK